MTLRQRLTAPDILIAPGVYDGLTAALATERRQILLTAALLTAALGHDVLVVAVAARARLLQLGQLDHL